MNHAELDTAAVRHALDWLGKWTAQLEASSLLLHAPDATIAQACLWRLPETVQEVCLESDGESALALPDRWPVVLRRQTTSHHPFLTLLPFTLDTANPPFRSEHILGCFHNLTSYRRLLHPGEACRSLHWFRRKVQREGYTLCWLSGVYPPAFLWRWALVMLCQQVAPASADFWRQRAFEHLSTSQPLPLQFSHIVVFYVRRRH